MSEELTVAIYLDPEFSLAPIVKTVGSGTTVADLKASLAQDDPTGQTRVEDFDFARKSETWCALDGGSVITQDMLELVICGPRQGWEEAAAAAEPAANAGQQWEEQQKWEEWAAAAAAQGQSWEGQNWDAKSWEEWARTQSVVEAAPDQLAPAEETALEAAVEEPEPCGPCEYHVVQGPLVKKPGTQGPTGSKIIKLNRKVGSVVKTTGQTWRGPAGGEWVELDPAVEKPGWLLVEGPGFDLPGPLLDRVQPDDPAVVLSLYSAIGKTELCEVLVKHSDTVDVVKSWIILKRREDTPPHKIWCTKATREDVDGKYFLKTLSIISTGTVLGKLEFKDGDTMVFVIIGSDGEMC